MDHKQQRLKKAKERKNMKAKVNTSKTRAEKNVKKEYAEAIKITKQTIKADKRKHI